MLRTINRSYGTDGEQPEYAIIAEIFAHEFDAFGATGAVEFGFQSLALAAVDFILINRLSAIWASADKRTFGRRCGSFARFTDGDPDYRVRALAARLGFLLRENPFQCR